MTIEFEMENKSFFKFMKNIEKKQLKNLEPFYPELNNDFVI